MNANLFLLNCFMNPRTLYLIKRAEIEVTSRMGKALEKYDITPIQFTVLYFVKPG